MDKKNNYNKAVCNWCHWSGSKYALVVGEESSEDDIDYCPDCGDSRFIEYVCDVVKEDNNNAK